MSKINKPFALFKAKQKYIFKKNSGYPFYNNIILLLDIYAYYKWMYYILKSMQKFNHIIKIVQKVLVLGFFI